MFRNEHALGVADKNYNRPAARPVRAACTRHGGQPLARRRNFLRFPPPIWRACHASNFRALRWRVLQRANVPAFARARRFDLRFGNGQRARRYAAFASSRSCQTAIGESGSGWWNANQSASSLTNSSFVSFKCPATSPRIPASIPSFMRNSFTLVANPKEREGFCAPRKMPSFTLSSSSSISFCFIGICNTFSADSIFVRGFSGGGAAAPRAMER